MPKFLSAFSGIAVNDLAKAKSFYSDKLGLKLDNEQMGLDYDLPGGGKLFIYQKDNHEPASYTVLNFVVSSIDQTVDELTTSGVKFERYDNMPGKQDDKGILRGKSVNQGPDIAWFQDPSGNILAVLES